VISLKLEECSSLRVLLPHFDISDYAIATLQLVYAIFKRGSIGANAYWQSWHTRSKTPMKLATAEGKYNWDGFNALTESMPTMNPAQTLGIVCFILFVINLTLINEIHGKRKSCRLRF
jgi:hypothetical protein